MIVPGRPLGASSSAPGSGRYSRARGGHGRARRRGQRAPGDRAGRGVPAAARRPLGRRPPRHRARRRHRARDRRRRDADRPDEPARVRPARRGVPVAAAHDRARRRLRGRPRAPRGRRARLLRQRRPPRAVRGDRRDRRVAVWGSWQRERTARAEGRAALLARAGAMLGASPDDEATLRDVAGLVVPAAADRIAIDVVEADGLRRVASGSRRRRRTRRRGCRRPRRGRPHRRARPARRDRDPAAPRPR